MKKVKVIGFGVLLSAILIISSCDNNGDFVIFSIEDDIALGAQVAAEIAADPAQFPILDRSSNVEAYAILDEMLEEILNSDAVTYKEEFAWDLYIIDDDETLNAFATPGGYIYVYTGLIFFLQNEDDLAGVMGHEVAHADQRHSSKQLQQQQGVSVLLSILLGEDPSALAEVAGQLAGNLAGLSFSRDDETEADEFSVEYLADTEYACNGAAAFFQQLLDLDAAGNTPQFLSTHPDPDNRVADINAKATEEDCSTVLADTDGDRLEQLKALLR